MKRCGCRTRASGGCLRTDHNSRRVWVRCAECGRRQRNVKGTNGQPKPCLCGSTVGVYDHGRTV